MAFAKLGEVELFYTDEGGDGPAMLFVHGCSCDSHDWSWQLPHFVRSHRVIAVDLRGHGRSSVTAGGYESRVFADDIAALLALLDCGPVIAIGHSLGALVVSALAVEHPEWVSAVVCVDPGYLFPDEASSTTRSNLNAVLANPDTMLSPCYTPATPAHLRTWHMRRWAGVPDHVLYQSLANLHLFAPRSVAEPYLRRRACPVLTLYASYDRSEIETPLFTDLRSRAFAWPGSGHWLHQERPAEFNTVVDAWLADIGVERS